MSEIYPIWWDTTVTIYNRFDDPITRVISWYSHVVDNCFWKYVGDKINVGGVVLETNNIICRIPENELFMKKYIWNNIPNDYKSERFTIGPKDLIINGAVDDVIDEYTTGQRSTDIKAKYKELQGCMEVQEVAINTGIGRNNPHYYVKGI